MKKITKKTIATVLALLILASAAILPISNVFAAGSTTGGTTNGTAEDKEPAGIPQVYIKSLDLQFFTQGKINPLSFTVANRNGEYVQDVKISASGQGDYKDNFTIIEGSNTYLGLDTIDFDKSINTNLKIDASVPDGVHKLDIVFSYRNLDGVLSSVTETCIIYITGSNESRPFIKSVSFNKAEIGKDSKAKMTAILVNPTSETYYGIKLGLSAAGSKDFTLYENFQPKYVGALGPNSSTKVEFSVFVAPTTSGNYPVAFDLTFGDENAIVNSYVCPVYATVKRSADSEGGKDGSTPRIIVSKYKTDVEDIKAGKTFKLDFTLENTSTTDVSNMKVTIGSAVVAATGAGGSGTGGGVSGDVFFPTAGSNSFFIEKLNAKQTVSKQIELMAKQDVEPGVYQVVLDIQYENANATPFKSEENIAFNVSQEQRLDVVGLTVPPDGSAGMPIPVTFQYINKGKATVYNLTVTADGAFTLDGGDLYIGNLTAGFNDYFDGSIIPTGTSGEQKGAIVLKFEDSQGNPKEMRNEFTINLFDGGGMGGSMGGGMNIVGDIQAAPEGMTFDPVTGEYVPIKKGVPLIWIIVAGVVVLGGGTTTFLIIRKKRKAKRELLLDEEN